jgi:hypothetical protein
VDSGGPASHGECEAGRWEVGDSFEGYLTVVGDFAVVESGGEVRGEH